MRRRPAGRGGLACRRHLLLELWLPHIHVAGPQCRGHGRPCTPDAGLRDVNGSVTEPGRGMRVDIVRTAARTSVGMGVPTQRGQGREGAGPRLAPGSVTCKPAFFARAPLRFPTSEAVSPQFPAPFSRRVPWFPREPGGDSPVQGPGAGEAAPCMRQAREKGSVWF